MQMLTSKCEGKPVRIRYGPAAVIGDELRQKPLFRMGWEGAEMRTIRKSEDRHCIRHL